jgi:hypothetical protein
MAFSAFGFAAAFADDILAGGENGVEQAGARLSLDGLPGR